MYILSLLFSLIFLVVLLSSVFKPTIGFPLFVAYVMLVPFTRLQLGNNFLGENLLYLLLPISLYFNYKSDLQKVNLAPFKPFIFLFGVQLVLIAFQDSALFEYSIGLIYKHFMQVVVFPMSVFALMRIVPSCVSYFKIAIVLCGVIIVGYGLFLTTIPGVNPYLMVILPIWGSSFNEAYALGYSGIAENYGALVEGRLFGRISSVFTHPMSYGLNLGLLLFFIYYHFKNNIQYLMLSTAIVGVAILTCGVRSAIGAVFIAFMVFVLNMRKFKLVFGVIVISILVIYLIAFISPAAIDYVMSIFDEDSSSVSGSSIAMRFRQFGGCFDIIDNCVLQGRGYGWTTYYIFNHTNGHPILLFFESLIYVVICNWGVIGVISWIVMVLWFYKFTCRIRNRMNQSIILGLFAFYVSYACITGDYGYMKSFMLFYAIILGCMSCPTVSTNHSLKRCTNDTK